MRIAAVTLPPHFSYTCDSCHARFNTVTHPAHADLDDTPFKAYLCPTCTRVVRAQNVETPTRTKVLFVCTMGLMRSATAAELFKDRWDTKAVGTHGEARCRLSPAFVAWADRIVCMEAKHRNHVKKFLRGQTKPILVLDIPDDFVYMEPGLIRLLRSRLP